MTRYADIGAAAYLAETFPFSISKSIGALLTRCRMTKYQTNPNPQRKKATAANTTTGLKAMPSTCEPLDCNFEQSIAAHNAVSNPNKKLAPTENNPTSRKLTINHTTVGITTCGGQPLLDSELDGASGALGDEVANSKGCWSSEQMAASSGCSLPQYVHRFMCVMLPNDQRRPRRRTCKLQRPD